MYGIINRNSIHSVHRTVPGNGKDDHSIFLLKLHLNIIKVQKERRGSFHVNCRTSGLHVMIITLEKSATFSHLNFQSVFTSCNTDSELRII